MKKKKLHYYYRYRSAVTGRCVSKKYAEKHPKTTVRERVIKTSTHGRPQ